MSGFKSFAVIGAGHIGEPIVEELLKLKASGAISSVTVVSRSDTSAPKWTSKGALFTTIDYADPSTFVTAFTNIDVVISTVGGPAIANQLALAKAAKSTGVKLFVPSEFGNATDTLTNGPLFSKKALQTQLKDLGLPYSLFFTGHFTEMMFVPPLGWDFANKKVEIGGTGEAPISFTLITDISRYLAHVLTTLPASELEWSTFRIEGDRLSFNDVVSGYESKTGAKLDVTHIPRSTLQEKLAKNPLDLLTYLRLACDEGRAIVGPSNNNSLWPGWAPRKVLDVLA